MYRNVNMIKDHSIRWIPFRVLGLDFTSDLFNDSIRHSGVSSGGE